MNRINLARTSLLSRIVLSLGVFALAMLLRIGIGYFQIRYVLEPMEQRSQSIQTISQFLNGLESCLSALEEYRWDYGDSEVLIAVVQERQQACAEHLSQINGDLHTVGEEQYLLANAARTTFQTLSRTLDSMITALENGQVDEASRLYYDRAVACGSYLRQYIQQLLEQACLDNQDAYVRLTKMNEIINHAQNITTLVGVVVGLMLAQSLLRLLRSVSALVQASQAISQGQFDTPDLDESQSDETGYMAHAFNGMKHSMKRQVELLSEKNTMAAQLHTKELEALELQNLMEREKLQQLRSQINPHFLFNTLNVIMYSSQQEGARHTHSLIGALSHLFRYALGSNEAQVPLAKEVQVVDELYALYRERFGERLRLYWHISPEVDLPDTLVPSFLLQPLVENSFKHGLAPKEEGGQVNITIEEEGELLRIAVADNGMGMSEEKLEALRQQLKDPPTTGEHIGIYNVAARLRLLGEGFGLEFQSELGRGTTAVLRLPQVRAWEEDERDDD